MKKSMLFSVIGLAVGIVLVALSVVYPECIQYRCGEGLRCLGPDGLPMPPSCNLGISFYIGTFIAVISIISLAWKVVKSKK